MYVLLIVIFNFQSANQFEKKLQDAIEIAGYPVKGNRRPEGYQEAPLAYDAVWAVALGKLITQNVT